MKLVLFCHSLLSDWNHGNAHFLRGLVTELVRRGHQVTSYERRDAWSVENLIAEHGELPIAELRQVYPDVEVVRYDAASLDLEAAVDGADLVVVHEWNEPELVAALGQLRLRGGRFRLLFHDTHHRSVTAPDDMARYDLAGYDGVLAFGATIRDVYLAQGWSNRVWIFHEAADVRVFRPLPSELPRQDLVWVGNWGDDERTRELHEYLLEPVRSLGLSANVYGVRYPDSGRRALDEAGIQFKGWLRNYEVPKVFARHSLTVHVPRRPYAEKLPGIPTIRVFEALACGIPLISAPWLDSERLFRPGDFLIARSTAEMCQHLRSVLNDADLRGELAARGLETVRARHTCGHRAEELLAICRQIGVRNLGENAWQPPARVNGVRTL